MAFGADMMTGAGGVIVKMTPRASDLAYVQESLKAIANGATNAIRAAVNDALRYAKTQITNGLGSKLNMLRRDVAERVTIPRKAARQDLSGMVSVDYKPAPLAEFKAKWKKQSGVTATPIKGESQILLGHAFIRTMKSGHKGVFLRRKLPVFTHDTDIEALKSHGFEEWEARSIFSHQNQPFLGKGIRKMKRLAFGGNFVNVTPKGYAWRLPIDEVLGPPVVSVFAKPEIQNPIVVDVSDYFHKRLLSKVEWILSKSKPNPPESA